MKHSKKFWNKLTAATDGVEAMHDAIKKVLEDSDVELPTAIRIRDELFQVLVVLEVIGDKFYDLEQDVDGSAE